jgi:hypothetical protein
MILSFSVVFVDYYSLVTPILTVNTGTGSRQQRRYLLFGAPVKLHPRSGWSFTKSFIVALSKECYISEIKKTEQSDIRQYSIGNLQFSFLRLKRIQVRYTNIVLKSSSENHVISKKEKLSDEISEDGPN